ncbi:MAG TPA: alpha/beta hydrolase, partial [Verrucomicrobiae bacterium]|nr:alpha/beta hydrolase [Verrucomicrobiae bacterium]
MKAFGNILIGSLLAIGLIFGLCFLHAQQTATPLPTTLVPAFSPATESLWLQINATSNGFAYLTLNGATNEVYEVWSKTDLTLTNWTVESEVWPTNPATMPFTVPLLDRTNALFIWARDWTGVTENGNATPDWWFWQYFGTLALSDTNMDSQGNTLLYDYQNSIDPNIVLFSLNFARKYVNSNPASCTITIQGGVPFYQAVLVNGTNCADANWQPYTSNMVVNLNAGDGNYSILVGLRGRSSNAQQTWLSAQLILDTVPPVLAITDPTAGTVSQPLVQLQGYANESLSALTFDVSNAAGYWTNRIGYTTGWFYDTNLLEFTTNWFQCYDVPLANGLNTVTIHATDLAGNTTTTNTVLTLDFSGATTPSVLTVIWPPDGTQIGGDSFTLQAQVSDPTTAVSATIGDNTVQGLVERNGKVWVKDLPLSDGINRVTLTTTSATGSLGTTIVNVFKSPVTVTINPLSGSQLSLPAVTLTGTVNGSGYDVWVNGIQAAMNGDGSWQADSVPVHDGNVADFDVEVYPAGTAGSPISSLQFSQPRPVTIELMSYSGQQHQDAYWKDGAYFHEDNTVDWDYAQGGTWHDFEISYLGPHDRDNLTNYFTEILPPDESLISPPWEYAYLQTIFSSYHGLEHITWINETQTRVMIKPRGQAVAGTTALYLVRATALEVSDPTRVDIGYGLVNFGYLMSTDPWWWYGDLPLPPEWLQINGRTLVNSGITNEDDDVIWGETIVSAPAGVNVEVTPAATQVHQNWDYTFDVQGNEVSLQLAVDADRDGNITFGTADATSADKPYRFWINNDYDGFDPGLGDYADLDPSGGSDADNLVISCTRDLEDYTRLWINTQGITRELLNGTFLLALEWKDVTDDPKIQFFQAAEPDGGARYLVDSDTAHLQYADYGTHLIEQAHRNILTKNNPFIFPTNFWTKAGVSTNQPVAHLLFDAVSRGNGQLVISIYKNDGVTKLAESQPLCLKLQDVKEMYERWTVGDGNGGTPSATAALSMRLPSGIMTPFQYYSFSPEENEYILFVHGWNLAPWERDAFAETAFKRLYWQGYKGRFGAFQWPTEYGFSGTISGIFDADNFDNSEFNAWSSGEGLLGALNRLNNQYPGQVYLMAHSMGNVVAGEALKLAGSNQVVNTYIAMQGAVAAHAYDPTTDIRTNSLNYLHIGYKSH